MSLENLPVLFVKPHCPWCAEVVTFLTEHGISYREKDVVADRLALEEMIKKSGQSKAPTLDWQGKILADFGVEELVPFLRDRGVKFEDS